jgi:hypothetical protein
VIATIREAIGDRGELLVELCLTDYASFHSPLFKPAFLGEKWPAVDYYVELLRLKKDRLYFLGQVKSTAVDLLPGALRLSISKLRVNALRRIPGPTYIFGVHEPSKRVFLRGIHAKSTTGISQISFANELNAANLIRLRDEVRDFWRSKQVKPCSSIFL